MKRKMKKLIGCVLALSLLAGIMMVSYAAPATPEETGNLIKASNFYAGNNAWSVSPNSEVEDVRYGENYIEEEVPAIGKTRALQITQRAGDKNQNPAVVVQYVRLTKGNTYKLSYWLKIEGEGSKFLAYYNPVGAGANRTQIESGITTTNGKWKKFEYTFNVDSETDAGNQEYIRFEMPDTAGDSNVMFKLTDVRLEQTVKNYVPNYRVVNSSTGWSTNANRHTVTLFNNGLTVTTKANVDIGNEADTVFPKNSTALPTMAYSLDAGKTYTVSFDLDIDYSHATGIHNASTTCQTLGAGESFRIVSINATGANMTGTTALKYQSGMNSVAEHFEFDFKPGTSGGNATSLRMAFAKPANNTGETITYNVINFKIVEKTEFVQETGEMIPSSANWSDVPLGGTVLKKAGTVYRIEKHDTDTKESNTSITVALSAGTSYKVSFNLKIEGSSDVMDDDHFKDNNNRFAFWDTGNMTTSLKGFNADENGTYVEFVYTPVKDTSRLRLFFGRPSTEEAVLTYTLTDFSVKKVIQEVAVTGIDLSNDNPGTVYYSESISSDETFDVIQRWECVNSGKFATADDTINAALDEAGKFTEFASAGTYRYSLILVPKEGYVVSVDEAVANITVNGEKADYYYDDPNGSIIIYPAGNEVFFTVMGDANMDGCADVRDLVRMAKYVAGDTTAEVYAKKCNFDTTTDGITAEDIGGLREFLVNR